MDYTVIRSARKTVSLEVKPNLQVIVRAPKRMSEKQISQFVDRHREWLKNALQRTGKRAEFNRALDNPEREAELKAAAMAILPERTALWAERMNLSPTGVKITGARTRFGSCSAKNSICYSWRLMAYPQEAIDYVIVHELAHILQKNHSSRFYAVIARYLPDWKDRRNLLKTK